MDRTIADVMTANPLTVKPETPLQDAVKCLADHRISGLPVVNDQGELVGVLSESDLMWQESGVDAPPYIMFLDSVIYLSNPGHYNQVVHKALGQTVGEVMTAKVITIGSHQSLREAAHLLHEKKIRRLPVVDPETKRLVGILTQGDIIRVMAAE